MLTVPAWLQPFASRPCILRRDGDVEQDVAVQRLGDHMGKALGTMSRRVSAVAGRCGGYWSGPAPVSARKRRAKVREETPAFRASCARSSRSWR